MVNVIIENCVQVVVALMLMLISVAGAWITAKIGKREELKNVAAAQSELFHAVSTTVEELQQTVVDGLKAAASDGKLTEEEIKMLGKKLQDGALEKMSIPSCNILNAAGVDVAALIQGFGEQIVRRIK